MEYELDPQYSKSCEYYTSEYKDRCNRCGRTVQSGEGRVVYFWFNTLTCEACALLRGPDGDGSPAFLQLRGES